MKNSFKALAAALLTSTLALQPGLAQTASPTLNTVSSTTKVSAELQSSLTSDAMQSTSSGTGTGSDDSTLSRVAAAPITLVFHYDPATRPTVDAWIKSSGATVKRDLVKVRTLVVSVPTAQLATLAALPSVKFIAPDRPLKRTLDYAVPATLGNIAHTYNYLGTNVGIAVVDSGVNVHGDLAGRVVYSENFVPTESTTADLYGHGTHVAGIAAGNAANSSGSTMYTRNFKGVAPGAKIINLRVLDANGAGTDSSVIAAIDRAIVLKTTYNIRVLNLSLGRRVMESFQLDPLCQAVRRAWEGRWQPRSRLHGRHQGLRHHRFAWQQPLRHHRGRHARHEHHVPRG